MSPYPIGDKFRAFNFHVIEVDGHNHAQLIAAFDEAKATKGKPTCIVAKTFMGHPISFMNDNFQWHGKAPTPEEAEKALAELA
jgi:transketolase